MFQNFQKHLIITLKGVVNLPVNSKNDPIIHLAQRMWRIFLDSRYYSKRILFFLFGVSTFRKRAPRSDVYEKFDEIASLYPVQEIQLAQEYLREQVVSQGRRAGRKDLLAGRRMRKGE